MVQEMIDKTVGFATTTGLNLVLALLLVLIGYRLIQFLSKRMGRSPGFSRMDPGAQSFIRSFLKIVLIIILVLTAANMIGVPMTSILAVLGSAGLAIGLALQGALGNLAGGLIILIFKPFRVGDYVDTKDGAGTVREINVFYTILMTPDNQVITLPNGNLTNAAITNYTSEPMRRLNLEISTPHAVDLEQIKSLLLGHARSHPEILQQPEPFCRLLRQGESTLVFALRAWCPTALYWNIYHDLLEQIKNSFDANEIAMPVAKLDVRLEKQERLAQSLRSPSQGRPGESGSGARRSAGQ